MFLLFKSVSQRDMGIVQRAGGWMDYVIGYLPDTHKDIFDYRSLNPRVLDEAVANAWMFIDAYKGYISVRSATPQNQLLNVVTSEEADGEKGRYDLTNADIVNTVILIQEILRSKLDEIYDKRLVELKASVSTLELNSWEQQKAEALSYTLDNNATTPLLTALAEAREITVAEMVTKVLSAVEIYNGKVAELLARKQSIEKHIKSCVTIADCHRLMHNRFGISMSVPQMQDEGVETQPNYDI